MDDQPTPRDIVMDRDRAAEEQGREHTGGLGETGGADTSGGAAAGAESPARSDADVVDEPVDEPDEAGGPAMNEPSEAERRGLGDIGQYGDAADPGQTGMDPDAETASEAALDTFAEGDLGASPPLTREEAGGAGRRTD